MNVGSLDECSPFLGFSMYQWSRNFSWRIVIKEPLNECSWVSVKEFSCCLTRNKFIRKSAAELISTFMMLKLVNVFLFLCWTNERINIYSTYTVFVLSIFFSFLKKRLMIWCSSFFYFCFKNPKWNPFWLSFP